MDLNRNINRMIAELQYMMSQVSSRQVELLLDEIMLSRKIFVAGAGRSGFMAKAFVMRLMHMGFITYVVGETVTPGIEAADLLIIVSGSGETGTMESIAKKAKKAGARLILLTIYPESTIGKIADLTIRIPASTPKVDKSGNIPTIQPMGSLFEQCVLFLLDLAVVGLMEKTGSDTESMFKRHANLE